MTMPVPVSPTPYVIPSSLISAPTGISWNTVPSGTKVTPAQRYAEQMNICNRATAQADSYCNQILRATTDTELFHGPGDGRVNIGPATGFNTRIILDRWPVLSITQVQVSPSTTWPRQWRTVTSGFYEPEKPTSGLFGSVVPTASGAGGQAILVAPGWVNWALGRAGYAIKVTYINGWPHAGITVAANVGDTVLNVDDCTGWTTPEAETGLIGATGTIYDGQQQETVQVTASSTVSGPGILTLSGPLKFAHEVGISVSTLPASVQWAVILMSSAMALARGATSTTVHSIDGGAQHATGAEDLISEAELLLHPYRRTV